MRNYNDNKYLHITTMTSHLHVARKMKYIYTLLQWYHNTRNYSEVTSTRKYYGVIHLHVTERMLYLNVTEMKLYIFTCMLLNSAIFTRKYN